MKCPNCDAPDAAVRMIFDANVDTIFYPHTGTHSEINLHVHREDMGTQLEWECCAAPVHVDHPLYDQLENAVLDFTLVVTD